MQPSLGASAHVYSLRPGRKGETPFHVGASNLMDGEDVDTSGLGMLPSLLRAPEKADVECLRRGGGRDRRSLRSVRQASTTPHSPDWPPSFLVDPLCLSAVPPPSHEPPSLPPSFGEAALTARTHSSHSANNNHFLATSRMRPSPIRCSRALSSRSTADRKV
jgi:hypothetical protein